MNVALINLGNPREVLSSIEALYISGFYQKNKSQYFIVVRQEFLDLYPIQNTLDVNFIGIDAAIVEKVMNEKSAEHLFVTFPIMANKFDIIINFSMTQTSFYLIQQMSAQEKYGPITTEKGKLSLLDEWSQVLFADSDSKGNFSWSKSETYLLIFQRIMSKHKLDFQLAPIINAEFIKTFLESKTTTQMCVVIPDSHGSWAFWSQALLQATKRLEIKTIKLFSSDQNAARVMQTLVPMGIDVDIFDQQVDLWPIIKTSDYYMGPAIELAPLMSLLQMPAIFVCNNWKELYAGQTLNPMHYWQCLEGWEEQGSQLAIALAPLIQKMINLEQVVETAKNEVFKVPGLCFRYQGLKIHSTEKVSASSAVAHIMRILWQFYFFQSDLLITNKITNQQDYNQLEKALEVIGLYVRLYEFMKHHSLKALQQAKLSPMESRDLRNAINDIQVQIQTLSNSHPELSAPASFFRAKLSAMEQCELADAAETLTLTVQEAGSCYLAVKDLLEQSLLSYNNTIHKESTKSS